MTSIQPIAKIPVIYVASPVGVLSGVSAQIVGAGATPVVGWLAHGLFTPALPTTLKSMVGKCDALFAVGIVQGDMNVEIAGATEAGIPVIQSWVELQDFIAQFAGSQITAKVKKASKKTS